MCSSDLISLRKVQPADTPLPLGYGENKGLKSGVARSVSSGRETIDRVFVKGSEQNIDPSNYGKFSEIYYAGQFIRHAVYDAKSRSLMLPSGGKIWYNGSVFKPYRPVVGDTPVTNLYQYIGKVDDESGLPNNPTYTASVPEVGNTDGYTLYEVTPDRLAVQVAGYTPAYNGHIVDGLYDGTDIYPKRTGKVDSVDTPDTTNIDTYDELPQPSASTLNKIYHVSDNDKWYIGTFDQDRDPQYDFEELDGKNAPLVDFYDKDDDCPDYTQCSIKGEVMTVIFQSGMLAGKEFELNTNTDGTVVTPYIDGLGRKFEIVPQEIDGQVMPSPVGGYMPKSGDKYAIFHCRLLFS